MRMRLSETSMAVINTLLNCGPCTGDEVHARLPELQKRTITKTLNNLKGIGYLECTEVGDKKTWRALSSKVHIPRARGSKTTAVPVAKDDDGYVPVITPPRQYDVMHAPVWVPPPSTQALRPGALDAMRVASYGVRC